jgi:hypothetical protein
MNVIIMYRSNYDGGDGWTYYPLKVTIAATCPVCGGKRGEPKPSQTCEDGEWFTVSVWNNPCGHVDYYKAVYFEAKKMAVL